MLHTAILHLKQYHDNTEAIVCNLIKTVLQNKYFILQFHFQILNHHISDPVDVHFMTKISNPISFCDNLVSIVISSWYHSLVILTQRFLSHGLRATCGPSALRELLARPLFCIKWAVIYCFIIGFLKVKDITHLLKSYKHLDSSIKIIFHHKNLD